MAYRDYRLLWIGAFVSFLGSWIQSVARGSLIFDLTGDPFALGKTAFLENIPMLLLGPIGGVIADRFDKRRALYITQTGFALSALLLGFLVLFGAVQVWHIYVLSVVNGVLFAIDSPIRQAMTNDLVEREDLANAIALNSATFNLARLIGPAVGGIILQRYGAAWCFIANGVSFSAILVALYMMHVNTKPASAEREPILRSVAQGMVYVARTPSLRTLITMVAVSSSFGFAYFPLMPAVQAEVLQVSKQELGNMLSAVGVGAMAGILFLTLASRSNRKGMISMIAMVMFGFGLMCVSLLLSAYDYTHADQRAWLGSALSAHLPMLSQSAALWAVKALLTIVGAGGVVQMAMTNTLVQTYAPAELRGRVLSVHLWGMMGLMPFGALFVGWIAGVAGTPNALLVGSLVTLIGGLIALTFGHSARRLE